jgi:hypothetical protein
MGLMAVGIVCVALAAYSLLYWAGPGLSEARARQIGLGMTREQVEGILGPPNKLTYGRQYCRFWDTNNFFGCHYVAVSVYFDADWKAARTKVSTFWRDPREVLKGFLR